MSDHLEGAALADYRLAEARKGHARGFALTPVKGKRPTGRAWQKAPRPAIETVEKWARAGNVGLRTGEPSGVIVIDDDTVEQNARDLLDLPITATMLTGTGKHHYYFRLPSEHVGNSASKLAPKVDVRGAGGMVVYAGSVHLDTGEPYRWAPALSPDDVEIAALPPSVIDRLRANETPAAQPAIKTKASKPNRRASRYAKQALRHAVERMCAAVEHTRNDTLNKEAFGLGRLVGAGWLHEEDVRPALHEAARASGLADTEITATLESGLSKGIADPVDESILRNAQAPRQRDAGDPRQNILIVAGKLPDVVSAAEKALLKHPPEPFFERAGMVVRIVRSATELKKLGINRTAGALALVALEAAYLVEAFMHAAVFQRLNDVGDVVIVDCPEWIARHFLARRGRWHIPHLEQVIEVPIMRPDGTLLVRDGYDEETELYLDSGGLVLPAIPERPTREDAVRALATLKVPLKDFPWVEASDRAAALAALLTVLVRPSIRTAPLFAFRAPKMASGKSLLADVIAMLATGRVAPVMTPGKDDDELRKRLTAFLLAGFPMGCIDNVEQPFGGEAICSVLTQAVYRDRILGKSEMATLPTAVTWTLTGNNVIFVGDVTSRVVVCDLDPQVEHPEERPFDVDLYKWVPEHRAELVAAGLTILQAYHVAGCPDQGLRVFGRFEDWSRVVRSALVWLGEADACAGAARVREVDPVREQLRLILIHWYRAIGETPIRAAEVIDMAEAVKNNLDPFRRAIEDASRGPGGAFDARRLGHYLAKVERRVEDGLQLVRMGQQHGTALWSVRPVVPPGGCGGSGGLFGSGPTGGEIADERDSAAPMDPPDDDPGIGDTPRAQDQASRDPSEEVPQIPHIPPPEDPDTPTQGRLPLPDPTGSWLRTCP